jgi:hypothetical protein
MGRRVIDHFSQSGSMVQHLREEALPLGAVLAHHRIEELDYFAPLAYAKCIRDRLAIVND